MAWEILSINASQKKSRLLLLREPKKVATHHQDHAIPSFYRRNESSSTYRKLLVWFHQKMDIGVRVKTR